jgi:endonuclease/exonuclease/phosphatase family metal-dependent hydrolase
MRVASYNIHRCVGTDGLRRPSRVAEVLRELQADVIGLQEVDARSGASSDSLEMDFLAGLLGLNAIAGPTIRRRDGAYGNAILSRWPVVAVRPIELTVRRREPRGALDVDLDLDGEIIRVIVTHLGLRPSERRSQVRRLLAALDQRVPARRVILCGDINEWFAIGRPLRWLDASLGRARMLRTYPACLPIFALDRIWVAPQNSLISVSTHRTRTARVASDHLPVVADIRL